MLFKNLFIVFVITFLSACGGSGSDSETASEETFNTAPLAYAGEDQMVGFGSTVNFDASFSEDSDGSIVSFLWKEGDTQLNTNERFSKSDFSIGQHTITLTVTDNGGASHDDTVLITVVDPSTLSSPLNDTGVTECGDYAYTDSGTSYDVTGSGTHNNGVDCGTVNATQTVDGTEITNGLDIVRAGQDAVYGRDVSHNDNSDGHAGFSFTKLDSNGDPLAASAPSWSCVKDNVTGLIWEVKTTSGLQASNNTYTWYSSILVMQYGYGGTENGGTCTNGTGCDVEKYVADVNAQGLCGTNDWMLPSRAELLSIVSFDRVNPSIDTDYFPNTVSNSYWTSTPSANSGIQAERIVFGEGPDYFSFYMYVARYVRLVRRSPSS